MKTLLIALLFSSSFAQAARFVVEARHRLTPVELKSLKGTEIKLFADLKHPYFSRLYTVSGNITKTTLEQQKWVKEVENSIELTRLSLEPGPNPERIVSDELFPYQWALLNQGQTYVREKDDIHNIPLVGVAGKDVGWRGIYNSIPSNRPIVAVLDSGVDLNHPDLQGNLWKNEKECGKDSSVDNDGNTLPGDCHGWNFTEAIDSELAKLPTDMDGHGSHVAGIIAAAKNGIGIVGANPNALIMPIKVLKDSDSKSEIATSEAFAQGIIYATNMGAQIINLSLGWPKSLETNLLRNAVSYALSKNVILVAAAGNNNSSEPLYPCSYDGVICAGASTLDGSFAGFSNYGGHVDTIAPGEGILSLNPTMFEPDFFSIPGYDIKSGTSQAAPLLSGMISILKAQKPDLTIDQVFARLYQSEKKDGVKKFTLGGALTWKGFSREVDTSIVRPVFKSVRRIIVTGQNKDSRLVIPFRNYGLESSGVEIKIESLSKGIEFPPEFLSIEPMRESEVRNLTFPLSVTDFNSESSIQLRITIRSGEGEFSYLHDLPVLRDIRAEANYKKTTLKFTDRSFPVGRVNNERIESSLFTIESYGKSQAHEFYTRRFNQEEKKLELSVFTRKAEFLTEAPKKIFIENFSSLVNIIRVDLNLDGKEDYLIQTVNEDSNGKYFSFHFFNRDLNPLWENFPSARVSLDVVVGSMNELSFIRQDHPKLGKIMLPAFFTMGQLPRIDQTQDFFQRWDMAREHRLYYLEPQVESKNLRIRSLTTTKWKDEVKKQLNSKWFENVLVENLLPVSVSDAQKGEVRVAVSVGQGTKRKIFITKFDVKSAQLGAAIPQIVLQTDQVDTLFSVTPTGLDAVGDVYLNVYDRSRSKIVMTKETQQVAQQTYTHVSETDIIAGHIASFEAQSKRVSILQTRDELVSLTTVDGKVSKTSRPKLRYSFFSNRVLAEMYTPVIFKRNSVQSPALYVDSTAVTQNRVYLFEEQNGKLISSIRNSIIVPANCRAMNPAFSESSGNHEFVFMCLEEKEWVIRTYDMK